MSTVEPEAEQLMVDGFPEITRLKVVCLLNGAPVTVMEWVPTGALGVTVKVITEVHVGEHDEFEMEYETPLGTPERDRVTDCVVPAESVLVMVLVVKALPLVLVTDDAPEFERL